MFRPIIDGITIGLQTLLLFIGTLTLGIGGVGVMNIMLVSVDERIREHLVTDEISIGDYVLTGGEVAAMVVVDAIARLLPGALGAEDAAEVDSHATGLLEGPHYTRPAHFRDWEVPEVLRSGHAAHISRWRREQALRRTWNRRPELLLAADLTEEDKHFLATLAEESVTAR